MISEIPQEGDILNLGGLELPQSPTIESQDKGAGASGAVPACQALVSKQGRVWLVFRTLWRSV
jgi:hypothetical protein